MKKVSHEKSNCGPIAGTVLYMIADEVVQFKSYTEKKDKDFVTEIDYNNRQAPLKEEAKEFIIDFLQDGEKEVSELDETAAATSISKNALKNAKADLKKAGKIKIWSIGYEKDKKFFICLMEGVPIATGETNE